MISWGIKGLDELTGGISPACVTLVYGHSKSGKTTLTCYLAIARIARHFIDSGNKLRDEHIFLIMDTDGGFSNVRLRQVLKSHGLDHDIIEDRIEYVTFEDFEMQHSYICGERGHGKIFERFEKEKKTPLLITLDGTTIIYRNIIEQIDMAHRMSRMQQYLGKLGAEAHTILFASRKFNCPAFITTYPSSQASVSFGLSISPAIGGRNLFEIPKTILRIMFPITKRRVKIMDEEQEVDLEDINSTSLERIIRLEKSRDRPIGQSIRLKLSDAGFSEV
ncbi:MAG: hypothetical protein ABIM44_04960 [candidate division WOR-3 bacterium]